MPHLLQIGIPDALGLIVGMADVIPNMGRLAAEITHSAHGFSFLSVLRPCLPGVTGRIWRARTADARITVVKRGFIPE